MAHVFITEIVRLDGVPKNIVSDSDEKFTSMFWKEIFRDLDTGLAFSIAYHPRRDGKQIGLIGSRMIC